MACYDKKADGSLRACLEENWAALDSDIPFFETKSNCSIDLGILENRKTLWSIGVDLVRDEATMKQGTSFQKIVVLSLLVISLSLALSLLFSTAWNESAFRGIQTGFKLYGTYQPSDRDSAFMSFIDDDSSLERNAWQAQNREGTASFGYAEKTADPNMYLLFDVDSNEIGWVHVAYANAKAESFIYVRFGLNEVVKLKRKGIIPRLVDG